MTRAVRRLAILAFAAMLPAASIRWRSRSLTGATPAPDTPFTELPKPVLPATMTIGSVPTPILFIGIPSGLAGETQINFTVPSDAPLGVQPVVVTVGGVLSPPANFTVNP